MLVISNRSNGHTLDEHHENYDRLSLCYQEMTRLGIPINFVNSCEDIDVVRYIGRKIYTIAATNSYSCPSCLVECSGICKGCNRIASKYISGDTYMTPGTFNCLRGMVGAIKKGCYDLATGDSRYIYLLTRPPGHHADEDPSGFCFINGPRIITQELSHYGYKRFGILDWDFHHGNGTQDAVANDYNTYFCSIHGYGKGVYPGTGSSDENHSRLLNIPINLDHINRKAVNNQFYMNIIREQVFDFFNGKIDVLIISNGLDAHHDDSLAGMNVDDDFYIEASEYLKKLNIPIIFILEGGYNSNVICDVSIKLYQAFTANP